MCRGRATLLGEGHGLVYARSMCAECGERDMDYGYECGRCGITQCDACFFDQDGMVCAYCDTCHCGHCIVEERVCQECRKYACSEGVWMTRCVGAECENWLCVECGAGKCRECCDAYGP